MGGGLDLRYLPGNWRWGVADSLFRKMAHLIECRADMLVADAPKFARPAPDPGPYLPKRLGAVRVRAPAGTTEWRPTPEGTKGAYPGAFPVLPSGRVLPCTLDLRFWRLELPFRPEGIMRPMTARARRYEADRRRARAAPS